MKGKGEMMNKPRDWCWFCGEVKNTILVISVANRTLYVCLKCGLQLREGLDDRLKGVGHIQKLRVWAQKKGVELFPK